MLDIKFIRENPELIKKNNQNRGVELDVDRLLELDESRRKSISQIEVLRADRNKTSKGKPSDEEIQRMKKLGEDLSSLELEAENIEKEWKALLMRIPNLTHLDVPSGGEDDFKILETKGKIPEFDFKAKDHEELMQNLGVIDFERGAKTSGSKFYFAKGDLVRLNQALIQYGIDVVRRHGFILMETPELVKNNILEGVGFNPRGPESNTYVVDDQDMSLIGTAEIPLAGYHAGETLDLSKGPIKYAGISHCFRTESGAYGRVSKGLYRVHQFTKLELFAYCKPEDSESIHQELLDIEKEIDDGLGLSYQVIDTASKDLGAPAYRKFDIESYMVMKEGYGEISSTSNCTDYQARRLNIRYKKEDGEVDFVHTLNGTAITTSRLPVAIFENFQTKEGTIIIPDVLRPYMGGLTEIK